MTNVNVSYADFSGGECSPKLYGRFDLAPFYSSHRRVENFITHSTGQASYRNGFNYAAATESNNPAFLYEWQYDESLSFILCFTEGKIRFFNNNGEVLDGGSPYEVAAPYQTDDLFALKFAQDGEDLFITHPLYNPKKLTYTSATSWTLTDHAPIRETFGNFQSISSITQADPAVVTYTGGDNFTNGQRVRVTGVSGMTEVNDKLFTIANVNAGASTFELEGIDSTGYIARTGGGIIEPINAAPAPFLAAGEYPSAVFIYEDRLIYGGSINAPQTFWGSRVPEPDSPYNRFDDFSLGDEVDDGFEYSIGGTGNTIKWIRGTNKVMMMGLQGDIAQVSGGIDGVITPSSISVRPSNVNGVLNINPIGRNSKVFYVQNEALTLLSYEFQFEQDAYVPVDRNVLSDHILRSGVSQIAFQDGRPDILWAVRNDGLMAGLTVNETESISGWHRHTTNGEFISVASLSRNAKGNQLWACVKRSINGSDRYYIEYMNDDVDFPARSNFNTGDKAVDYAMFANQMFEAQKQYIHLDSCLSYYGDAAGIDASASVSPAMTTGTSITFTASANVFSATDVGREIWKKSVTGVEEGRAVITAYVSATEVMCDILEDFDNTDAMTAGNWYLTVENVSGLSHLEGEIVSIVADGGQHAQKTVASGSIALDRQASVIHVGFSYEGYLETNSLEGGGTNGTSQTKKKSVVAIGVRVHNTMFGKVGTDYYSLEQIYERTALMKMDRPPLPYTGDKKLTGLNNALDEYDGGWQRQKQAIVVQDEPFPCTVQLVVPYMDVSNV